MASKVKATSSDKNIDIQINIENNLFSKNKGEGITNKKKGNKPDILAKLGENVPEEVAEVASAKAERRLYESINPQGYSVGTWKSRFAQYNRWNKPQYEEEDEDEDEDEEDDEDEDNEAGTAGTAVPTTPAPMGAATGAPGAPGAPLPQPPPTPVNPIIPQNINTRNLVYIAEKEAGIMKAKDAAKYRLQFAKTNGIPVSYINKNINGWQKTYKKYIASIVANDDDEEF